jgi:hypothetical protein
MPNLDDEVLKLTMRTLGEVVASPDGKERPP